MNLEFEKPVSDIEDKITELKGQHPEPSDKVNAQIAKLEEDRIAALKEIYAKLTPWQTVQVARHANRPLISDFIAGLTSDFTELHGDRLFGDDHGIIGGFATIEGRRVMLIGHQKGKNTEENVKCNFGMARPEGYRKAMRLMHLAEKFNLPVISLIDTPGAFPGVEAEERGQAEAIARNLLEIGRASCRERVYVQV